MDPARLLATSALLLSPALTWQEENATPSTDHQVAGQTLDNSDIEAIQEALAAGDRARSRELLESLRAGGTDALRGGGSDLEAIPRLRAIEKLARELRATQCFVDVCEEIVRVIVRALGEDHLEAHRARQNLAVALGANGDSARSAQIEEETHAALERLLPADHDDLLRAKLNLAVRRRARGETQAALELNLQVHDAWSKSLDADHPHLLIAKMNLAISRGDVGDLPGARDLLEVVHASWESSLSSDHPNLLAAKQSLASVLRPLGDLAKAHELFEEVHAARERVLPAGHSDLLSAKSNLSATRRALGDIEGALELAEYVYEVRASRMPRGHPVLLDAQRNLSIVRRAAGDLEGALELIEGVLAVRSEALPADHPAVLEAMQSLATTQHLLGDLDRATALFEQVHRFRQETLSKEHPALLTAKGNLAGMRKAIGDFQGALELEQYVLDVMERTLPADSPERINAIHSIAGTLIELGEVERAHELFDSVLETLSRIKSEDDPVVLGARSNLAAAYRALGQLERARSLYADVHDSVEGSMPPEHVDVLLAKANLAIVLKELGDYAGALELEQRVHDSWETRLTSDHPRLLQVKQGLVRTRYGLGDLEVAKDISIELASSIMTALEKSLFAPPREARSVALRTSRRLAKARVPEEGGQGRASGLYFSVLETARVLTSGSLLRLHLRSTDDSQVFEAARRKVRLTRAAIDAHLTREPNRSDLDAEDDSVASTAGLDEVQNEWNRELAQLGLARDAAEKEFIRLTRSTTEGMTRIGTERLAAALGENEVAIGLHRLDCWNWTEAGESDPPLEVRFKPEYDGEHYIAYVLRSDQSIAEIDLGPADAIDELLRSWRATIGASVDRGLGEGDTSLTEVEAGRRLREALFDPLIASAGIRLGATIFLCVDDALFTGPLDALPLDNDSWTEALEHPDQDTLRLGDAFDLRFELSFARLLLDEAPIDGDLSVLTVGGIDFDDAVPESEVVEGLLMARHLGRSLEGGDRNSTWRKWSSLNATRGEIEAIADFARYELGIEAARIEGVDLTHSTLEQAVQGKRFVHIATHGWFMPESVRSMLDHDPNDERLGLLGTERTITGFAPLALCGLVLSGANAAESNEELAQRLLTAMELASFDLSACELAVLSACETNVGIARAGQGIQSLQSALHQAGARASLTSLWRVDDYATRDLMRAFYSNLWEKKMGKADALWDAKRQLRERGEPVRHWAGWVLVGDPD